MDNPIFPSQVPGLGAKGKKHGGWQVLIDPVCLLTIYPQLLRNFLYKVPSLLSSSSLLGVIDWMRYIFSRDLLIAEVCLAFVITSVGSPECLLPYLCRRSIPCSLRRPVNSPFQHVPYASHDRDD